MANKNIYIATELSKVITSLLKNMAAKKMKISAANIKEQLLDDENFLELIKNAMAGGEKSEILRYVTPLKGFVADAQLKTVEDMIFDPDKGFDESLTSLLNVLSEHIVSLERRQHKVSNFIEDVFTKFANLQSELTNSFQGSIDFVQEDLAMDQKLLGDAEDMHKVLKSEESIDYLRTKMLESFSNFVDTFGNKTESKKGHLDNIHEEYTNVNSELEQYKSQVTKLQNDLNKYKTESLTDHMTGLYNRKYMDMKMSEEIERFKRTETPFCVVLADIDHFKSINDNYGHLVGDQVLKHLAKLLQNAIRKTDFAFRYGGEEFMVLLTNANVNNAKLVAENIRKELEKTNFSLKGNSFNCTASFGISLVKAGDTQESVTKRADDNLYKAKQTGRNKVVA